MENFWQKPIPKTNKMPWLKPNKDTSPFPNYSYWGYNSMEDIEVKDKIGIYAIINETNKKVYIGSSVNMRNRWKAHKKALIKNIHHSPHLQNAWNKYGEKSFTFTVLEIVKNKEDLIKREQYYIDFMGPKYNASPTAGSILGMIISKEGRENMSKNHADVSGNKNPMFGVKFLGSKNHMFGRKRLDWADFNTKTKKGKTWEEIYGVEKAKDMKIKLSLKMKNNNHSKKPIKCQDIQ